jgi:hypothetical protein
MNNNRVVVLIPVESYAREFSARVRATSKNLLGMVRRWGVVSVVNHPIYTLVLFVKDPDFISTNAKNNYE